MDRRDFMAGSGTVLASTALGIKIPSAVNTALVSTGLGLLIPSALGGTLDDLVTKEQREQIEKGELPCLTEYALGELRHPNSEATMSFTVIGESHYANVVETNFMLRQGPRFLNDSNGTVLVEQVPPYEQSPNLALAGKFAQAQVEVMKGLGRNNPSYLNLIDQWNNDPNSRYKLTIKGLETPAGIFFKQLKGKAAAELQKMYDNRFEWQKTTRDRVLMQLDLKTSADAEAYNKDELDFYRGDFYTPLIWDRNRVFEREIVKELDASIERHEPKGPLVNIGVYHVQDVMARLQDRYGDRLTSFYQGPLGINEAKEKGLQPRTS